VWRIADGSGKAPSVGKRGRSLVSVVPTLTLSYKPYALSFERETKRAAFLNILESQTGSELARQLAQKRRSVHDQPDSLKTSSIREFRRDGRIDIDADGWDRGRQQIARRHRVQRRGDEQGQSDTGDCRAHGCLGFNRIRDHAGQRAVIADRAGHDDVDTPPDTGRHNSGLDDSRPDRSLDAADGPDPINLKTAVHVSDGSSF